MRRDMIKLNTNENPYPPAPGEQAALNSFSCEKLRLYPEATCESLVKCIGRLLWTKIQLGVCGRGSDRRAGHVFYDFNSKKPILFPDTHSF